MRRNAILLLGLLLWADPASAQKPKIYPLTVSIHNAVHPTLTQSDIEQILTRASDLLQSNRCGVGFKLKAPVTTFTSAPAYIKNAADLEAVHSVPADVKVVQRINFCVGRYDQDGFIGCSWRPEGLRKTVIVTTERVGEIPGIHPILWAHEFGHTTGLLHRVDNDREALMSPCDLQAFSRVVNRYECGCFLAGPGQCNVTGAGPACPDAFKRRRHQTD
jgi:hypothetical protein